MYLESEHAVSTHKSFYIVAEESMMKNMGGPSTGMDSSQMKEQMKRIGEMSPDELKSPLDSDCFLSFLSFLKLCSLSESEEHEPSPTAIWWAEAIHVQCLHDLEKPGQ